MKLELVGHDYKYVAEQSLLALFPQERPVYGAVDAETDRHWAIITIAEQGDACAVTTELGWDGHTGAFTQELTLAGDDFAREGQRRRAIGMSFFRAAREAAGIAPPWGSLTGTARPRWPRSCWDRASRRRRRGRSWRTPTL